MKKVFLLLAIAFIANASFGQKYDNIKGLITLGQIAKAKDLLDKSENEKFYSKPEAYLIKSSILGSLAVDTSLATAAADNRNNSYLAFNKYKEMDPSMKLLEDPVYKNAPYTIYAAYFNAGVQDINDKSYETAYDKFKKVVELSDILAEKKIASFAVDTNALYYAGVLAETNKKMDEAIAYNTRLANLKLSGANYESIYQSLVRYYALKNDDANFAKYQELGKSLYPNSEFFTYSKLDFLVGASANFDEKIKNLEAALAQNPNDYKLNMAIAEAIYDTLNSRKEGAVLPANYDELEARMLVALEKAESIDAEQMQTTLLKGDHFITKSERYGDEMRPIETDLIKKGAKATAADKQKLADVKKKYDAAYDMAKGYFEKAADKFAKIPSLDANQKRQYRIIVGNLAQYYSYKRESAKGADLNKFVALETKYNTLYDQLKK